MSREVVIGRARLILGDCRDVLPMLPKIDAGPVVATPWLPPAVDEVWVPWPL